MTFNSRSKSSKGLMCKPLGWPFFVTFRGGGEGVQKLLSQ